MQPPHPYRYTVSGGSGDTGLLCRGLFTLSRDEPFLLILNKASDNRNHDFKKPND